MKVDWLAMETEMRETIEAFKSQKYDAASTIFRLDEILGNYTKRGYVLDSIEEVKKTINGGDYL